MSKPTYNAYHGTLKDRRDVERILGSQLPADAVIWWAWGTERVEPNMNPNIDDDCITRYSMLVWWTHEKQAFAVFGKAEWWAGIDLEWKLVGWKKQRADVVTERDENVDLHGIPQGWPDAFRDQYKGAMTNLLDAMDQWDIGIEPGEEASGPFRGKVELGI